MKKVNEVYFLTKLNEAQDNPTRKFYCELIEHQNNFDSEYKIEKFYTFCKINYESLNIYPLLEISNTTITFVKYFLNNLNYSPLPKTIFYLNSILLMTFKLLLDSNNISNLIILYSKYLSIIKDEKIKEIIKQNKSVKYTKNKIINLFKEAKKIFQKKLNTRKNYFSNLITENKFQENNKMETEQFFNNIETEIKNILNKNKTNKEYIINEFSDILEESNTWYLISIDWINKFLNFKKFLDEMFNDLEGYKYFLFTGFDADNVILNIINNYSTIKNKIVSYIGPIINENCILNLDIMKDPDYLYNNSILSKDYTFINEKLYLTLSDFFGIDFEIKREKKYFEINFALIIILNEYLKKKDLSSICREIISFEEDMTYEKLKLKIIRCIKYKYETDFSDKIINIYLYQNKDEINSKNFLFKQNFFVLNAYGLNLVNKLYIKCIKLNPENFESLVKIEKEKNNSGTNNKIENLFFYIEIIENEKDMSFIVSENENVCILCNNELKENNIFYCDESEKCLNKYCSLECMYNDKKHINFHIEINKYYIQNITIEKLVDKDISFPKESKMGLTGLINYRNNCYINSSLQCLSNCFHLTKYFLSNLYLEDMNTDNKNTNENIAKCYKKLLKNLWKKNLESVNSDIFGDIFINNEKKIEGYGQYDASEFLIFFLDKLHQDLNRSNNNEYIQLKEKLENETEAQASLRWWKNHLRKNDSIIIDLFHGQLRNNVVCDECKNNSIIYDPFMILTLNIPKMKFNLEIKYFGINLGEFQIFNINLNEESKVDEYKIKIIEKINEDKKNNKNKKRKINKKKNKIENSKNNNFIGDKNEAILNNEINNNNNSIELILLTKEKKIFKILNNNELNIDIISYINQGYELVAYEKEEASENIYFYLLHYIKKYFLWIYPYISEELYFLYPLPLSIKSEQNLFNIYQKIYQYINELTNLTDDSNFNLNNNDINYKTEEMVGFVIYLNTSNQEHIKESFCTEMYNYINYFKKTKNKIRILEKFNMETKYSDIKYKLKNKRLILYVDILNYVDEEKIIKIDDNNFCNKINYKTKINLYDCLDTFISEEKIEKKEYFCSKCKKLNKFTKKMDLFKAPYYLLIQFNRFKLNQESNRSKIFNIYNINKNDIFIDFPIQNLDLTEYFIGNEQKNKFNLIGVINHFGDSFNGHYTAYCLNRNNWYCFDDENISEINKKKIVTDSAYVLFYQKIN